MLGIDELPRRGADLAASGAGAGGDGAGAVAGVGGASGASGTAGGSGMSAVAGESGSFTTAGASGASGAAGESGSFTMAGASGIAGAAGASGLSGAAGVSGGSGTAGVSGSVGAGGGAGAGGVAGSTGTGGAAAGNAGTSNGGTAGSAAGNGGSAGKGGTAGSAGSAGSGGAPVLGGSCSNNGALACAGPAQKLELVCSAGKWSSNGTCSSSENCDNASGVCKAIVPGCENSAPNQLYCDASKDSVGRCGPDLVTSTLLEDCTGGVCRVTANGPGCVRAVDISAGTTHSCAVSNQGTVRCWGQGSAGQLGYGNIDNVGDTETPASQPDVDVGGKVVQISAGGAHTCALLDTGKVRCWGSGARGRLGYGNTTSIGDTESPASAGDVPVGGSVTQIAAGGAYTCALLDTGAVRCWGTGSGGQLGYGNTNDIGDNETPASAGDVPVGGLVSQIATGAGHTCALLTNGAVRCWGGASSGRLGYGNVLNIGDDEAPSVAGDVNFGGTGTALQVTAGSLHTCVITAVGSGRCWGSNLNGRLGFPAAAPIGDNELPSTGSDVSTGIGDVLQISAGAEHNCALVQIPSGGILCWGNGASGRLGYGNVNDIGDNEAPSSVGPVSVGGAVAQVAAGGMHTCARLTSGAIRCWGLGSSGQLGYGNTNSVGDGVGPSVSAAGDVPVF